VPFVIQENEIDGEHRWAVATCGCDLTDDGDALLQATVTLVREAYGENELLAAADPDFLANVDPLVAGTFDLDAIRSGFRLGLPDPEKENLTKKQPWLRNYRSETTEMVARGVLKTAHHVDFPSHPQRGKANANQPFLGFDGWGLLSLEGTAAKLVLVQVKGTDDTACPPSEARKLAQECKDVPRDLGKLARAISVLAVNLKGTKEGVTLLQMLEQLGKGILPPMAVAPVIIRGITPANGDDLQPIRQVVGEFLPACARGVTVSINVALTEFGERVMTLARAA
jgi:hypothetical protein